MGTWNETKIGKGTWRFTYTFKSKKYQKKPTTRKIIANQYGIKRTNNRYDLTMIGRRLPIKRIRRRYRKRTRRY